MRQLLKLSQAQAASQRGFVGYRFEIDSHRKNQLVYPHL
jgi:hypothetical protein